LGDHRDRSGIGGEMCVEMLDSQFLHSANEPRRLQPIGGVAQFHADTRTTEAPRARNGRSTFHRSAGEQDQRGKQKGGKALDEDGFGALRLSEVSFVLQVVVRRPQRKAVDLVPGALDPLDLPPDEGMAHRRVAITQIGEAHAHSAAGSAELVIAKPWLFERGRCAGLPA